MSILARQFAVDMGAAPDDVEAQIDKRFSDYSWPGNVRELRNVIASYVALGDEWHPPQSLRPPPTTSAVSSPNADWIDAVVAGRMPYPVARRKALAEFERRYVEQVLSEHGGNVAQAARASGLGLRYFRLVKARRQPKTWPIALVWSNHRFAAPSSESERGQLYHPVRAARHGRLGQSSSPVPPRDNPR